MSESHLKLLNQIYEKLREAGFNTSIKEGSICVYRQVADRHTNSQFALASAIGCIYRNEVRCLIYCVEQSDKNKKLKKFSVKLNDLNGTTIMQWDLDTKRGLHKHEFKNAKKKSQPIAIEGDVNNVLASIVKEVKKIL